MWGRWGVSCHLVSPEGDRRPPRAARPQQVACLTSPTHLQRAKLQIMRGRQLAVGPLVRNAYWAFRQCKHLCLDTLLTGYVCVCIPSKKSMPHTKHPILNNHMFWNFTWSRKQLIDEASSVKTKALHHSLVGERCGCIITPTDGSISKETSSARCCVL